jgi:hypothetical protein
MIATSRSSSIRTRPTRSRRRKELSILSERFR